MKTVILDADVVLRYLLADHPELSKKAKEFFVSAEKGELKLYLDEVVLAEIVWTLGSFHKIAKPEITAKLKIIVFQKWLICPRKGIVLEALNLFSARNVDYLDAWLFAVAKNQGFEIASFDKDLKRLRRQN